MLGPIDFVVIGFEGNNFDGSILDELEKAVDSGTIRVVDLVFIVKDAHGAIIGGEVEDQPEELKELLSVFKEDENLPLISEKDLEKVAMMMKNDTAAGVLVVEHLWAKGLKKAIMEAGGKVVDEGRIHPDVIADVMKEIEVEERELQESRR